MKISEKKTEQVKLVENLPPSYLCGAGGGVYVCVGMGVGRRSNGGNCGTGVRASI